MKKLILLLLSILIFSCSTEPIEVSEIAEAVQPNSLLSKGKPGSDPADSNTRKIMFEPTVEGTLEERIASFKITSAHAKPVSINWNFLGDVAKDEDLKAGENLQILRVVIYEKGKPTQWIAQTSTSGWRGFWVAQSYGLESGKTYILWFQTYDIKVEFVMPKGKV